MSSYGIGLSIPAEERASIRRRLIECISPTTGCWLWTGPMHNKEDRARFYLNGRYHYASRVIYALVRGSIPAGQVVCHRCDNPTCVRPSHLFLGTQLDNLADMRAKGRADDPGRRYAERDRCPQGHPYDDLNTYVDPGRGARHCRTCRTERDDERARSVLCQHCGHTVSGKSLARHIRRHHADRIRPLDGAP